MRHRMDSTILIEEIRRRPILWDRRHPSHNNKKFQDMHWEAIAANLGTKRESVKAKWKNLRDAYRKILKKAQLDGGQIHWIYYDQLSFIKDQTLGTRDRCRSVLYPPEMDIGAMVKMEVLDQHHISNEDDENRSVGSTDESGPSPLGPEDGATSIAAEDSTVTKKRKRSEEEAISGDRADPDYQFLMSLLPHVKDVPVSKKLPLRMKIEAVVHEYAYAN